MGDDADEMKSKKTKVCERQGEASSYLNLFKLSEGKVRDDVDENQISEA